ncbi:MAG TPA: AAA family ATPase [Actinomycetota bacterium]|nr:AAA family ATPase [Actinomycetota bacterium]
MFLRSLSLRGFKSFGDKTTLEFTSGISVIVGPNGSGKSNIVDAISWVLGEQGPRALRGASMGDVIFAGSPARPALGMAEVRLVIDNGAGKIPVPATELEISRAVYRSGESEYRLAGRPCRLLDIQEILSDSGVGRALHTIVGQGQLDAVLWARPEERRQFIEEAAGIAKHRRRRDRAERKLAGLEQDLIRLQDVASELRRQLKPLKQQADLARRHESLSAEAAEVAAKLAAARLRELYAERDRRLPAWEAVAAKQQKMRERLAQLDNELARLDGERAVAEAAERRAEELYLAAVAARTDAESRLRLAIRREGEARERAGSSGNRTARLFALEEELERTEQSLATVRPAFEEKESALRAVEAAAVEARSTELAALRTRMADLEQRAERLEVEIERLDATETPLAAEETELTKRETELAGELAELEVKDRGLRARAELLEARRRELTETPGTAFLERTARQAIGILRDLISVPEHLEEALRAALGPAGDAVVYADQEVLLSDAEGDSVGAVVLMAAEPVEARTPYPKGTDANPGEPLLGHVTPDPRVRRLASVLLANVYLAGDLREAVTRREAHPWAQFVTPDGYIVGETFVRTPAAADRWLEEVATEQESVERQLAATRDRLGEAGRVRAEVSARMASVKEQLEQTDLAITAAAEEKADTERELASLRRQEQVLSERLGSTPETPIDLRVEVEALRRDRSRLDVAVQRLRKEIATLASEDPEALLQSIREAQAERGSAEELLRNAEGNLAGAEAARRAATEALRKLQAEQDRTNRDWRHEAAMAERLREEHEEDDRARHDLELRIGEAERILREGHDADAGEVVASLTEDDSVDALQRRADVVARRLNLVGRVNMLALGELESLQERHDFLNRELEDVRAARRDLHQVIREIDGRIAELFQTAFADVSREFSSLFSTMFPDGEGRLTLLDPDAPLSSGVEIEARPGRGRVKRLSLLSGGERALSSLAFLFAIFRARPSPFYVLDEVEAALDDVNLHRFLEVLREFARDAQILVVTHQKRTMEIADVLYGVSMRNDGASRVISQRLAVEAGVR